MKTKKAIETILDEQGYCGSDIVMTRREVLKEMQKENHDSKTIDYFVFGPGFHVINNDGKIK